MCFGGGGDRLQRQVDEKGLEGITRITCEMCLGKRKTVVSSPSSSSSSDAPDEDEEAINLHNALEACSLILGMHPDQATDAIADVAYEYGKPFVIVPVSLEEKPDG